MKSLNRTLFALALCAWLISPQSGAQEEEFKAAKKLQERQTGGLTKLADKIQNIAFLDYARKLVDRLDKKERKIDPFGMPMDPIQEGAELVMPTEAPAEGSQPKTSLQEAVSKFRVTGVFPSRHEVIVGAQSLRVGDQVVIKHGDFSFNLKISKVDADSVELTDLDTGETAGVTLGIVQAIPAGMTRKQPRYRGKAGAANEDGSIVPMNSRQLTLDLSPKASADMSPNFGRE